MNESDLIEVLADMMHIQWAHWAKYQIENSTEENLKRWKRQIQTDYKDLTEKEKDSDRHWAKKIIDKLKKLKAINTQDSKLEIGF